MDTMQKAGFIAKAEFIDIPLVLTFNQHSITSQNHSMKALLFLTNQNPSSLAVCKVNLAKILTRPRGHTQPIHV